MLKAERTNKSNRGNEAESIIRFVLLILPELLNVFGRYNTPGYQELSRLTKKIKEGYTVVPFLLGFNNPTRLKIKEIYELENKSRIAR